MCTFKKPSYHQRECFINEFPKQTLKQIGKRLQICLEHFFCWKIFRNYNDMISKTFYIYEKCSFFHKVILFILLFSPVFIIVYRIKIPNNWGGRHKNAIFRLYKSLYPQKWKNVVTDKLWHMNGDYEIFEIDTLWFWVIYVLSKYFPPSEWRWTCGKKKCHLPMLFLFATKIELLYKWWSFLFT